MSARDNFTRADFAESLNELPIPGEDLESEGGRIPDCWAGRYGEWMRRNDPIAFEVAWQEEQRRRG